MSIATEIRERWNALRSAYESTLDASPVATLAALVGDVGEDDARLAVAELVNAVGDWDERVSSRNRDVARTWPGVTSMAVQRSAGVYLPSWIHPAHIDQLASAAFYKWDDVLCLYAWKRAGDRVQAARKPAETSADPAPETVAETSADPAPETVAEKAADPVRVHISEGKDNRKFRDKSVHVVENGVNIRSISLPPVITCAPGCRCAPDCYACHMQQRYPSCRTSWARNLDAYKRDPAFYWSVVEKAVAGSRYFRFHVSGDAPDLAYMRRVFEIARRYPECEILMFTKRYLWASTCAAEGVPDNLHVVISVWRDMAHVNPHHLPEAHVLYKDGYTTAPDGAFYCGGNCADCARNNCGCWTLKAGESVVFRQH